MPHSEAASPRIIGERQDKDSSDRRNSLGISRGLSWEASPKSMSNLPRSTSRLPRDEIISPLLLGKKKSVDELNLEASSLQRRPSNRQISSKSRRLSGRSSNPNSPALRCLMPTVDGTVSSKDEAEDEDGTTHHHDSTHHFDQLIDQVSSWIKEKRVKRHRRKGKLLSSEVKGEDVTPRPQAEEANADPRRDSDASDSSLDLEALERIVRQNLTLRRTSAGGSAISLRHKASLRRFLRKPSYASDSDHPDNEFHVPTCDVVLDNSKTLAYTGGASESDESGGEDLTRVPSYRDIDAWAKFKFEIVRLSHTLRLKGWRKVSLESSAAIEVQRLSGALTNAVYVVTPPNDLPLEKHDKAGNLVYRKPPPKLLLRIYGPQVEHLIDREAELAILRRLAKKRIGPRLLGTFTNGRFEEYLHAKTLTPDDLRDPSTSRQIAKRMRELHSGIDLLDRERSEGAFVWRNWDKWLDRVEQIVTWMDAQVLSLPPDSKPTGPRAWMRRGLICGMPWKRFRQVVEQYRAWLETQYGGLKKIQDQLIFAHNDTQYGNLLRVIPTGESPLLLPANSHKQLVVIDFEYANANMHGLEFANHFTEWCYDYHDTRKPYQFNTSWYPTPEEQDRFIRAYVQHQPQFETSTPKVGPVAPSVVSTATPGDHIKRATSSISEYMLDARNPQMTGSPASLLDSAAKSAEDAEVERLMHETRLWRLANTAQWVAWGIVQAKVPGMPLFESGWPALEDSDKTYPEDLLGERAEEYKALAKSLTEQEEEQEEEFDYLGYAQHRAHFFWADAVQMKFIKLEELPEETRAKLKTIPY